MPDEQPDEGTWFAPTDADEASELDGGWFEVWDDDDDDEERADAEGRER